ncbi:MAG TPA: hypothetical protein VFI53_02940 [Myxococcaceae bacterium]|nr:hypothetical protein [Myxococcaceae bacterium]
MADPKSSTDDIEEIRKAGSAQKDADQSSRQESRRGVPPTDDEGQMRRSAETGEGEVPGENPEAEELEEELPSNRSQKRGGP